jgi:hypothetical protein
MAWRDRLTSLSNSMLGSQSISLSNSARLKVSTGGSHVSMGLKGMKLRFSFFKSLGMFSKLARVRGCSQGISTSSFMKRIRITLMCTEL